MRPSKRIVPASDQRPLQRVKSRYTTALPELPEAPDRDAPAADASPRTDGGPVFTDKYAGRSATVAPDLDPVETPPEPRQVIDLREPVWVVVSTTDGTRYRRRDVRT